MVKQYKLSNERKNSVAVKKLSYSCPKCKGRAFDIKPMPKVPFDIQLKCPNCHKIVTISIAERQ